jgi:hypothetical protein
VVQIQKASMGSVLALPIRDRTGSCVLNSPSSWSNDQHSDTTQWRVNQTSALALLGKQLGLYGSGVQVPRSPPFNPNPCVDLAQRLSGLG